MKHILLGILVMGVGLGNLAEGQVFLEQPADVVIYKEGVKSYAQVTDRKLANPLKIEMGSIIASSEQGLSEAEVIQKAINTVHQIYKDMESDRGHKGILGKVLIRNGTYELGKQGIRIPHGWPCTIEGEDRAKTILQYDGEAIALGFDKEEIASSHAHPGCIWEVRKLTVRITGNAEAAIWSIKIEADAFSDISIVATKKARPKRGLWIVGGEGHLRFVRDLSVIGPFEVGIDDGAYWVSLVNVEVKDFRKYGIKTTQKIFHADIFTKRPGAKAGIVRIAGAGGGGPRCLERMVYCKSWAHLWGGGGLLAVDVRDNSPLSEGYSPFFVRNTRLNIANCRAKSYEPNIVCKEGRSYVNKFDKELSWVLPDLDKLAKRLSRPEPKVDVIVFTDENNQVRAQVISKRLARNLRVEIGHLIPAKEGEDRVQKAIDLLPPRGKIYFKQGIYKTGKLEISWDREITIEGTGNAGRWWNMGTTLQTEGITFKGVKQAKEKFPFFCIKNIRLAGGSPCIKLSRTSAVVENVNFSGKLGILIDGGKDVAVLNCGGIVIEDRGRGTIIINPWVEGMMKLGPHGALLGSAQGGAITNPADIPEKLTPAWRQANSSVVLGLSVEGPGNFEADGPNIYLFGCGEHNFEQGEFKESNGGRVVVLR